jgi:hypothetical protein
MSGGGFGIAEYHILDFGFWIADLGKAKVMAQLAYKR